MPRPMPSVPPVTIATFPASPNRAPSPSSAMTLLYVCRARLRPEFLAQQPPVSLDRLVGRLGQPKPFPQRCLQAGHHGGVELVLEQADGVDDGERRAREIQ